MSLANHLEELQRKHGDIEREIDEALLHPSVDDLEIVHPEAAQAGNQGRDGKTEGEAHPPLGHEPFKPATRE